MDFRSFSINKYCLLILLTGVIQSINTLIAGYIILQLSAFSFIFAVHIIVIVLVFAYMLLLQRQALFDIPHQMTVPLLSIITLNNLLWIISYTITLYLMKEL